MKYLIALALLFSVQAQSDQGGGWTGGGGLIVEDSLNPWFIQNTETVRFCVSTNPSQFFVPKERVTELIHKAFDYWKSELSGASGMVINGVTVEVGSQNFIEECSENTDIWFQMGYLTEEQKMKWNSDIKALGFTYRTHYDRKQLRGKGLVYIAPEDEEYPEGSDRLSRPWSFQRNGLLYAALIHEIGHIFGLFHGMDSDSYMSVNFVENVTKVENAVWAEPLFAENQLVNYIKFKKGMSYGGNFVCTATEPSPGPVPPSPPEEKIKKFGGVKIKSKSDSFTQFKRRFLGLPPTEEQHCLYNEITKDQITQENKIVFKEQLFTDNDPTTIGYAHLQLNPFATWNYKRGVIQLWMSREQQVFAVSEGEYPINNSGIDSNDGNSSSDNETSSDDDSVSNSDWLFNRAHILVDRVVWSLFKGTYLSLDGQTVRSINVKISPEGDHVVSGFMDGQIFDDIDLADYYMPMPEKK